ncbi:MAG: hypothetical protein HY898_36365 [Deltaproteobacteria bacterium]|nr:hypothetical protein [Deltaproteobacteria bacterium]
MPRSASRAALLAAAWLFVASHARGQAPIAVDSPRLCLPSATSTLPSCRHPAFHSDWVRAVVLWSEGALTTGDVAQVHDLLRSSMGRIDAEGTLDLRIRARVLCGEAAARLGRAQDARARFDAAIQLWSDPAALGWLRSKGADAESRTAIASAVDAVGRAVFHLAKHAQREADDATGRLDPPPVDAPDPAARSKQTAAYRQWVAVQLPPWMKAREASLTAVERLYRSVFDIPPAPPVRWSVAAAEAIGEMWAAYVTQLRSLPIPQDPPAGHVGSAYRHTPLDPVYEPFRVRAKGAYVLCLGISSSRRFFDATSARCEAWLARNHRQEFRALVEYVPPPTNNGSWLDDRRVAPRSAP